MKRNKKLKIITMCVTGFLLLGGSVSAQENPNNFHARHNAGSTYNVDRLWQSPAAEWKAEPTGYWETTWGAIAADGHKGILGTFTGAASKQEAEAYALAECGRKGGVCKVFTYYNQCAVLVSGKNHYVTQGAENLEIASELGLEACQRSDTGCSVFYSACTEPKFHRF